MKKDFIPVLRFVVCSDAHIEGIGSPGYNRLKEVIDYSLDFAVKDEQPISGSLMFMGIKPLVIFPVIKSISSLSLFTPP